MRFTILGVHQPGAVEGISRLTARVRMFPIDNSKEGVVDEDFVLPVDKGFVHEPDSPMTRYVITSAVEARMAALFKS